MIESVLISYFNSLDIPCGIMLPDPLPRGGFIVLDRIGTGKTNHVTSYEIAIQSYGDTAFSAASLNEVVIEAMENLLEDDRFSRIHLNNSQMQTDTERKLNRYQSTFEIVML
jgi:hypothetical protein